MDALVAIDLPGGSAFVDALRRAWDDGDAVVPLDQRLAPGAKAALTTALGVSSVIVGPQRGTVGTKLRLAGGRPVEPGDALVMATSGTTGEPKGVVLTHAAVAASARATSARLGVDPARHRWLACLPLNHVGGLSVVTRALATGTDLEVQAGFDHEAVAAASGPEVLVSLVPTALARVGAGRWHTVVLGGSSPPPVLASNVTVTYGLTETGSGVVYDGEPLQGVEVDLSPGTREIRLRAPMLLRCYRSGGEDRDPRDAHGWFATGDVGSWGSDGRLAVEGRLSDLIVTGGENVWPGVVERILAEHPSVAEVAVAGRPDPIWGERVCAWIVPAPGATPGLGELRAWVRDRLAGFAAPRQVFLVEALPKTSIGKIRREALPG